MTTRWIWLTVLTIGLSAFAHDKHGKKHAPAEAVRLKNPIATAKPELGKDNYESSCGACHGADGVAVSAMTPKPPKLADAHMNTLKDGELFWVITNGIGKTMPGFKDQLSDTDRWQIVNYVRALAKKAAPAGKHAH